MQSPKLKGIHANELKKHFKIDFHPLSDSQSIVPHFALDVGKPDEDFSKLADDILLLVGRAYPGMAADALDSLALEAFLDANRSVPSKESP